MFGASLSGVYAAPYFFVARAEYAARVGVPAEEQLCLILFSQGAQHFRLSADELRRFSPPSSSYLREVVRGVRELGNCVRELRQTAWEPQRGGVDVCMPTNKLGARL